ncbi:MAG TPA: hypothetical protein VJ841_03310 [Candidatus Saccharimonadales bacterium]|nr:hypothetical protein [Candidatus Saccharimonadales bacterium]
MNPEQPPFVPPSGPQDPVPPAPLQQPATSYQPTPSQKKRYMLPITLMAWPIVGIVLAVILYFISLALSGQVSESEFFSAANPATTTLNVAMFIIGGISMVLGPISFVIGLVVLIIRVNQNHAKN